MINLLYVDDEVINLIAFKMTYKKYFNVETAKSGTQALELLNSQAFDVIVSDQKMPDMSGVDLLKKVEKKFSGIKRYILTGYIDNPEIEDAKARGTINDCFHKPYNQNELKNNILNDLKK